MTTSRSEALFARCRDRLKKIEEQKDSGYYAKAYTEDVSALLLLAEPDGVDLVKKIAELTITDDTSSEERANIEVCRVVMGRK